MTQSFKLSLSIAASWAWGTSLILGMQIAQEKGLVAWITWAICNCLTLVLFGYLYNKNIINISIIRNKYIKILALCIQVICLIIQLNILNKVFLDLNFSPTWAEISTSMIGIIFILLVYKYGLSMSVLLDSWQALLTTSVLFGIIALGYFFNVPQTIYTESSGSAILWGFYSGLILFCGPIGDLQHHQRAERDQSKTAFYKSGLCFAVYLLLVLWCSIFEFNWIMNLLLLFCVLNVTTTTIDSIAVALHELINKQIGTLIGLLICVSWVYFVDWGIITIWSYAGIFRILFALLILGIGIKLFYERRNRIHNS